MPWTVVALAHNHVQMRLARRTRVADPLLEDIFGFLDELPVQVDGVGGDAVQRVVLPEYVLGGLFVVLVHESAVAFAFFGELMRGGAIAALVGLLGLWGDGLVGSGCLRRAGGLGREEGRGLRIGTFAEHEERLPASCRARSRRRSYSLSESEDEWWLKAGGAFCQYGVRGRVLGVTGYRRRPIGSLGMTC